MNEMPRALVSPLSAQPRILTSAIAMLAVAAAIIVTTEFIAIGLLPAMARDLGISLAEAGRFVAWFALSAAIFGPILTIAGSRIEPRRVVVLTLLVFGLGNLAITLMPSYPLIVAVRILQGAALPVFISIGNAAVARLVGSGREGRAIALINLGTVVAIVLAVPAGIILADRAGWLASFFSLAILALIAAIVVGIAFPRLENSDPVSMKAQIAIIAKPAFQAHLLLSGVLFTAMFTAYTYLAGFLEMIAGFDGIQIGFALFGFGAAGLLGNLIAGHAVDRGVMAATIGVAAALVLTNAAVSLVGARMELLLPLLAFWGAAHTAAFVLCQVRVMRAGSSAPAFASSLNISVCNLGIAFGAVVGGWIVERYGIAAIGFGSAGLAAGALVIAVLMQLRPVLK